MRSIALQQAAKVSVRDHASEMAVFKDGGDPNDDLVGRFAAQEIATKRGRTGTHSATLDVTTGAATPVGGYDDFLILNALDYFDVLKAAYRNAGLNVPNNQVPRPTQDGGFNTGITGGLNVPNNTVPRPQR